MDFCVERFLCLTACVNFRAKIVSLLLLKALHVSVSALKLHTALCGSKI